MQQVVVRIVAIGGDPARGVDDLRDLAPAVAGTRRRLIERRGCRGRVNRRSQRAGGTGAGLAVQAIIGVARGSNGQCVVLRAHDAAGVGRFLDHAADRVVVQRGRDDAVRGRPPGVLLAAQCVVVGACVHPGPALERLGLPAQLALKDVVVDMAVRPTGLHVAHPVSLVRAQAVRRSGRIGGAASHRGGRVLQRRIGLTQAMTCPVGDRLQILAAEPVVGARSRDAIGADHRRGRTEAAVERPPLQMAECIPALQREAPVTLARAGGVEAVAKGQSRVGLVAGDAPAALVDERDVVAGGVGGPVLVEDRRLHAVAVWIVFVGGLLPQQRGGLTVLHAADRFGLLVRFDRFAAKQSRNAAGARHACHAVPGKRGLARQRPGRPAAGHLRAQHAAQQPVGGIVAVRIDGLLGVAVSGIRPRLLRIAEVVDHRQRRRVGHRRQRGTRDLYGAGVPAFQHGLRRVRLLDPQLRTIGAGAHHAPGGPACGRIAHLPYASSSARPAAAGH